MSSERDNPDVTLLDSEGNELFSGTAEDFGNAANDSKLKNGLHGLVAGALGSQEFDIPSKAEFDNQEFLESASLKQVGDFLISKYEADFWHLSGANIIYLWKEKGGETGGVATLGKCIRPTGLAKFFACEAIGEDGIAADRVDYIIWAAADHLRANRANIRTVHALIFHELCHTHYEDGKRIVVSHEFEGFAREIEEFGMWTTSIKRIAEACDTVKDVQQGLFNQVSA